MLHWIAGSVAALCAADAKKALRTELTNALTHLGFVSFNMAVLKTDKRQFMTEPTLTSWSWADLSYYDEHEWHLRDPLLAYAVTGGPPFAWTAASWDNQPEHADYSAFLRQQGLRCGVTAPLLCTRGEVSAITGLSYERDRFDDSTAAAVKILGEVAAERACALGITRGSSQAEVNTLLSLSETQLTILDWARQGKSNADIATITNRSKRSVDYHMSEILKRLNVTSRTQAISIYCGM